MNRSRDSSAYQSPAPSQDGDGQSADLDQRFEELQTAYRELEARNDKLHRQLRRQRREQEEWNWFFEHSQEMLCIAGLDGYFKCVNPAFIANFGFSEEELLARPVVDFVHPDDIQHTLDTLRGLGEGGDSVSFESRFRDATGVWHWVSWHCPILNKHTHQIYAIARDVTEQKRTEAHLLYRASHDPLTSLLNRAAFEEALELAISRVERQPDSELAVYLIDLNGFKQINDNYGHQVGDEVLKVIAGRFRKLRRHYELVGRLGGDEFAWLAEGHRPLDREPLAERIMDAVCQPIRVGYQRFSIGCCIGISGYPGGAADKEALLSQADDVMYQVKRSGKVGYAMHYGLSP